MLRNVFKKNRRSLKVFKYMLYLFIEKVRMKPKRQTPVNLGAQSCASAKAERQTAEVKEVF